MDGWNKCNKNQDDEAQDWDMSNYNATILQNFTKFGSEFLTFLSVHHSGLLLNTLRAGLLNRLNARSRGLTFRHRASCI